MEEIQKRVDASFEKDRKKILSSPGPWSPAEKKQIDQLLLKLKERQDDEKLHTGLRVAIRALRAEKKNGEIAKLIQSCLIHAKPKPWMYQALAIALMLNDAPKEEVERAFVSALDFADSPQDLYMMGAMLGELGFEERALTVFKDLTELLPFVNKPYSMALTIAERSKSWKDKIWISERIMGKDWTSDNARIAKRGYFAAKGVKLQLQQELTKAAAELKKLSSKKEGEISAEAFTAAFQRVNELRHEIKMFDERMRQASFRDCIIRVSWTGDADIDLVVEEPPGTVCSADHPITQAGGVFSGNDYAFVERGHTECEETYSCAKGFPGTYRFAIYRRWGRPTEDKVIVETILNKGQQMKDPETGKMVSAEKRIKRVVLLKENTTKVEGEVVQGNSAGAIGEIALANGRRKDKISDFQLANAEQRMRLLPHLIGQKLAKVDNKYVQEGLADSGYNRNDRNLRNFNPLNPLTGGNSVGYQPVIVVLPTGANLQANAVISADRKYVRISCVPIFSHISSVTTFNLGTGETTISDPPPITPAPPPPGMNPGDGGAGGGGAGGGIDTQAAINSLNAQIAMLQAQIAALDPVQDAVLIATLQNTIAELQNTVTLLGG